MSNLKKWVLAVAIAIVLNLFINYGISVFYKAPQYDDFCKDSSRPYTYPYKIYPAEPAMQQPKECATIEVSEDLQNSCNEKKGYIAYKYNTTGCPKEAYCELCGKMFDDVNQKRNSNVFVILVIFGVAAIIAGMLQKVETVANGFLFGGILSLVIAAIRNWGQLQDVFKFIILGAVLALLIWTGYKKGGAMVLQQRQVKTETVTERVTAKKKQGK